jgi:hypothetical protein
MTEEKVLRLFISILKKIWITIVPVRIFYSGPRRAGRVVSHINLYSRRVQASFCASFYTPEACRELLRFILYSRGVQGVIFTLIKVDETKVLTIATIKSRMHLSSTP